MRLASSAACCANVGEVTQKTMFFAIGEASDPSDVFKFNRQHKTLWENGLPRHRVREFSNGFGIRGESHKKSLSTRLVRKLLQCYRNKVHLFCEVLELSRRDKILVD